MSASSWARCEVVGEMEQNDIALKTTGLVLAYGNRIVLDDVNLEVRSGQFCFFLGPNGSGKTTLLRAILGVLRPRTGQLWLHPDLARLDQIGFVPQRCDINPTLPTTVREFVLLGLVGIRASRNEESERLDWALDRVRLAGLEHKDYWSLSGGQRQRALVARALVRRPKLLILDEPTNGLDVAAEDALLPCIERLNLSDGLTIIFVTHDIALAARYAKQVALFRTGSVASGAKEAVFTTEELTRTFGGAV